MFNFRGKALEKNFEKFILDNKEKFYKLSYCYVKNHHDALDIIHESILKAYGNLNSLKDEKAMNKWFSRIVVNTAVDFIRKDSKMQYVEDEMLKNIQDTEYSGEIEMLIDVLELELKSIIILKYFHGYKISEVAEILDLSESTVKNRMHKALKILRVEIREEENVQ